MAQPPGMPSHNPYGWALLQKGLSTVGSAAFGATEFIGKNVLMPGLSTTAKGSYHTARTVGEVGLDAAQRVGHWALGMDRKGLKNWGSAVQEIGTSVVNRRPEYQSYNKRTGQIEMKGGGLKFTKLGLGLALAGGVIGNLRGKYTEEKAKKMGEMTTKARSNTPDYQPVDYQTSVPKRFDNAGATGDLVFALHRLR